MKDKKEGKIMNKKEFGLVFGIASLSTLVAYSVARKTYKVLANHRRKKTLRLKDVLPCVDKSTEVRYVNDRSALFYVFLKRGNFEKYFIENKKDIIDQDIVPTKLFLLKGGSYNNDLDTLLNKKVAHVSVNEDNCDMLDILLVP